MNRIFILGLIALSVTACSKLQGGLSNLGVGGGSVKRAHVEIDGTRYKAKANTTKGAPRDFTISVTPAAANPAGAVEAGRYEATRFCLLTFGGSDKEWTVGPDTPIRNIPISDNTMTLRGRCTQR